MQPLQKTVWRLLKKLKTELTGCSKPTPGHTFRQKIHASLRSGQSYAQQPRHGNNLSAHQYMNGWRRYVSIYNGILLGHKKEQNNAICSNMDTIRDFHIKRSQTEKDKYHMRYNFHVVSKIWHTNPGNPQGICPWWPVGFDYRTSIDWGKQRL